jgi:hypothetical protein
MACNAPFVSHALSPCRRVDFGHKFKVVATPHDEPLKFLDSNFERQRKTGETL